MKGIARLCRELNSRHYFVSPSGLVGVPYCGHVNWYMPTIGGYSMVGQTENATIYDELHKL